MGVSETDILVIVIAMFAGTLLIYFFASSGSYIMMNTTFDEASYVNKSICDDVNCSDIKRYEKSVVPKVTTTTTTLSVYFFNTSGGVASLVRSNYGDILINCGDSPHIMDKVYFSGSVRLKNIFVTIFDPAHGGGCARTALMLPHGEVYDSGFSGNVSWIADYVASVGNSRKTMVTGNHTLGKMNISSLMVDDHRYIMRLSGKGYSIAYIGDCSQDYAGFSDSNMIVCDSDVGEDVIMRHKFKNIVVFKSNSSYDDIYRKYGITAYKMDFNKDYIMTIRDNGFLVSAKKGI
jgi:hypothetical protein